MLIDKSQELNHIFGALSKLQGKVETAKKDQKGYNSNYSYADLTQYIELSKEILEENGLSVIQLPGTIEVAEITRESFDKKDQIFRYNNITVPKQTIDTIITHSSGQFIVSRMEIIIEKLAGMSWGQSTGSAITYARRYARGGALGMTQEDNDNQNVKEKNKNESVKREPMTNDVIIDKLQTDKLKNLLKDEPERLRKILDWAGVDAVEKMSLSFYNRVMDKLREEQGQETTEDSKRKVA